jgi:hypothetical protein
MIVQFFRYGNGMSKGPLNYLLGKDRDRDHAKILSGDENEIAALIDTSPFAKKYTAGCLSFYENDLSEKNKQVLMREFETCLFPGMSKDQYRVLWIEHKDKLNLETGERRLELNFLIPNTEITTGQRLQPYFHKADLARVDLFKKIINFKLKLHDPNDPLFQQAITNKKSLPKAIAEIKSVLDQEAQKAIESGLINDRVSMKNWLTALGLEITRETAKSISIKNPNDDEKARSIRLTGAIYEQSFGITATSAERTRAASEEYRRAAKERYAEYSAKRRTELEQQYRQHKNGYTAETEPSKERDVAADRPDHNPNKAEAATRHDSIIAGTTTADHTATSELAAVEQLEPRNSPSSEAKETPYYIEYSFDFTSMYNAYQQYLFGIRQQQQIQRHKRDAEKSRLSEITRREHDNNDMRRETVCGARPESLTGQLQLGQWHTTIGHSERGTLNEYRSTTIADYRATTRAIETATAANRTEMRAVEFSTRAIEQNIERTRKIVECIGESRSVYEPSKGLFDGSFQSNRRKTQVTREQSFTSEFIEQLAEKFRAAVTTAFTAISDKLKYRESIEIVDRKELAEDFESRDRNSDHSACSAIFERERDGYRISRKVSSFNTRHIFTALDVIDQRKQQKLQQEELKRNKGMNFDM